MGIPLWRPCRRKKKTKRLFQSGFMRNNEVLQAGLGQLLSAQNELRPPGALRRRSAIRRRSSFNAETSNESRESNGRRIFRPRDSDSDSATESFVDDDEFVSAYLEPSRHAWGHRASSYDVRRIFHIISQSSIDSGDLFPGFRGNNRSLLDVQVSRVRERDNSPEGDAQ